MSNYSDSNLISIPAASVPAGTLAMKVGNNIFTAGSVVISGSSMDFYKCSYVNSNSWGGYKAVQDPDTKIYSFESNSTEGLLYDQVSPAVDGIYSQDALIKVAKLWGGNNPTQGLVFYAPLSAASDTAATGQSLTTTGTVTYQTEGGVPCAYFDGSSYISSSDRRDLTAIQATNSFTISLWTKIPEAMSYGRGLFMGGDGTSNPYGVYINGNSGIGGELSASGGGYLTSAYGKYGTWAHICFIGNNGNASLLVDGVEVATKSYTSIGGSTSSSLLIGKRNTDCVFAYIAGVRVYSRALSSQEISMLASQFTPTA